MQQLLPAIEHRPLRLILERLLLRPSSALPREGWLEAVLAAYTAAVVLPASEETQQGAEQLLVDTLTHLQQAAAVRYIWQGAAQHAVAAAQASPQLAWSSDRSGQLKEEALRFFTSPDSLQMAAAAELLAQHALQLAEEHPEQAFSWLASVLEPAAQLHLELLCWLALLPDWEHMLQRLAGAGEHDREQSSSKPAPSCSGGGSGFRGRPWCLTQRHSLQLLCAAVASRPEVLLHLTPELAAEVCRLSFRFTCSYGEALRKHLQQAAEDTAPAAAAAHRRLAHAIKHPDHVADYLRAKCCVQAQMECGAHGSLPLS
jgi:hypothetical protein